MAAHMDCYSAPGPSIRPIFGAEEEKKLLKVTGLTEEVIRPCYKQMEKNGVVVGKNVSTPFNTAIVLAVTFYTNKKDERQISNCLLYMIANIYPFMYNKYFKFPPNESVMAYTIANMSRRFKVKKTGSLFATLIDMANTCYNLHKEALAKGLDISYVKFINDMTTRVNSFVKKIRNEFETNIKNGNYLQSEKDDFSDEHYHEADSDSFAIDRITNKVLTNLVVNGPDRKLVELAAKNSTVSVNVLQTSVLTLISEKNRDEIRQMIECLIGLYINDNPDKTRSIKDIGTNKFYVYCIKVYRQSNTSNANIIKIKAILDKWVEDLGLRNKVGTVGSLGNYRKAIYTFFVFTIEKLA
jgi:hypothetical protein